MVKIIIKSLIVLLLMGIIFSFSADTGNKSTKKSDYVITKVGKTFFLKRFKSLGEKQFIEKYVVIVRKTAHFILYFCLSLAIFSLLKEFYPVTLKSYLWTVLMVFLYACSDEVHQVFVAGRSGSLVDIFLDTLAGGVAAYLYFWGRRSKNEQEKAIG